MTSQAEEGSNPSPVRATCALSTYAAMRATRLDKGGDEVTGLVVTEADFTDDTLAFASLSSTRWSRRIRRA
jgi:hypothetical protein